MRLFIAITFTEDMLDALSEIQDDLRRSDVRGSYTPRENLHMTLAFIGEYDDPEQIVEVMRKVPLRSFSIKLSGYQPFKDMIFVDDKSDVAFVVEIHACKNRDKNQKNDSSDKFYWHFFLLLNFSQSLRGHRENS